MDARRRMKPQAWLDEQRRTIGSSLSAATFGAHEFLTPLAAYHVLTGAELPDISDKPDIIRGNLLEPVGALRFTEITGMELVQHPQHQFIYSQKYPFAHSCPDYMIAEKPIILEIKVPNPHRFEHLDEEVPLYWTSQCFHHLAICPKADAVILVALNPVTMEIWRQPYERDDALQAEIMEKEREFWETHVLPRVPPPPSTQEDVRLAWPTHDPGKHVIAKDHIENAHRELMPIKAQHAEDEKRIKELNFVITSYMENAEILRSKKGELLATYRSHPDVRLDSKKLKEELPEVWNDFKREKDVRVFLPKAPK